MEGILQVGAWKWRQWELYGSLRLNCWSYLNMYCIRGKNGVKHIWWWIRLFCFRPYVYADRDVIENGTPKILKSKEKGDIQVQGIIFVHQKHWLHAQHAYNMHQCYKLHIMYYMLVLYKDTIYNKNILLLILSLFCSMKSDKWSVHVHNVMNLIKW